MTLLQLPRGLDATVAEVRDLEPGDPIARRLRELGFVPGETVRKITTGPFGRDPLLVKVGEARFALRRPEAERVLLQGRNHG